MGGGYIATFTAGAGFLTPPVKWFRSLSTQRSASVVSVNAEHKVNPWPKSTTTTTTTTTMPTVGAAMTQEDRHINGKAVVAGAVEEDQEVKRNWRDYFELAKSIIRSDGGHGSGPPRWFSPLETASRMRNSPLLLYLPGLFVFSDREY